MSDAGGPWERITIVPVVAKPLREAISYDITVEC